MSKADLIIFEKKFPKLINRLKRHITQILGTESIKYCELYAPSPFTFFLK